MDYNPKKKKDKGPRALRKLVMLVAGLLLMAGAGLLYAGSCLSAVSSGDRETISVVIPEGASANKIARLLEANGLIKNWQAFVYYSRLTGMDAELKSGEYNLSPSCSIPEIVDLLAGGTSDVVTFTVPEGYTMEQLGDLLEEKNLVDRERLDYLVANGEFHYPFLEGLPDLPAGSVRLEGYLFPDTYHVGSNSSEEEIINMMLARFQEIIQELEFAEKAAKKGLTLNEAVTIASMVEKEAKVDNERALIAGVIFNRLERGMPLQIDATVQYVLPGHRSKIYYKDLEVDSPYNTYRVVGLPPGPIGAPGKKSLQAVLEPEETGYLYYVAKPDGTHAFARTLHEHNENIRKYQ